MGSGGVGDGDLCDGSPERYDVACGAYAFTLIVTLAVSGDHSIPLLAYAPGFFIAGHDADLKLQQIYGKQSELVVVCVSQRYDGKTWTLAEHEAIRARLFETRSSQEERDS